ncbi:MAG TPA: Maf family protein, partial [Tepidisphaeraceae bacterium]|nr:Maf family protein [Tepidisphaeraceae bacterium]
LAERLAIDKARVVATRRPETLVLGADTVVALFNPDGSFELLGKPDGPDDARRMLQRLSGTIHQVITGIALLARNEPADVRHAVSGCRMKPLSAVEIDAYVATGLWAGKAGGYGIQDDHGTTFRDDPFIQRIEGSFSNIVGLPMELVESMLMRYHRE